MRLLIDISGIAYRAAYSRRGLSHRGTPTGVVFGTLQCLERLAQTWEPEQMVICWDGGKDLRQAKYPTYKANRKRDPEFVESFNSQLATLRAVLDTLPVLHVVQNGAEGDDVIAVLARFLAMEEVGIVTSDHDLFQLSHLAKIIAPDGSQVKPEHRPGWYCTYKVIVGDSSDNIKGLPGVGEVTGKRLIAEHKTLGGILKWLKQGNTAGKADYKEAKRIIKRNLSLISLTGELHDELLGPLRSCILEQYRARRKSLRLDAAGFEKSLRDLGIASILRRAKLYCRPFQNMVTARAESGSYGEKETVRQKDEKGARPMSTRGRKDRDAALRPKEGRGSAKVHRRGVRKIKRVVPGASILDQPLAPHADAGAKRVVQDPIRVPVGFGRSRLVRRCAATVFRTPQAIRQERVRRENILSILSAFATAEGEAWLKKQNSDLLFKVERLIRQFECDRKFVPGPKVAALLKEAHWQFTTELPEWMGNG